MKKLIPKSIATPELLSYICTSKYADGLPLYRLNNMFKRLSINISRQVMSNWVIKCSLAAQPLVNMIRDELYNEACVHIDESPIQVLREEGKKHPAKAICGYKKVVTILYSTITQVEVPLLLKNYLLIMMAL